VVKRGGRLQRVERISTKRQGNDRKPDAQTRQERLPEI
jgi:hypothetical protein